MRATHLTRTGALAVIAALSAMGIASVGAAASTDHASGGGQAKPATITATIKGKKMEFQGPRKVKSGAQLQIVNGTDPEQTGPHTFTLVKKSELPRSKQQMKDCEHLQSKLCQDIVKAQKANPETGVVKKPNVDVGKKGWDKSFGKTGDTWFSAKQGESTERKVTAKAGKTLYYFCAIHPFMQGRIKVVK